MKRACGRVGSAALVVLCAGLVSEAAWAGGFFLPGHGARTQGRGGAGVLGEPDMNALFYNPAMLAGLGDLHVMADINLLVPSVEFQRAPRRLENGEVIEFEAVQNEAAPVPIPQLGVASDFGTDRYVVAFGAFAPNAITGKYPVGGPQRYTLVDTEGSLALTMELAGAMRVTDWLWVGAGFQNVFLESHQVNIVSAWPGFVGDAEEPEYDVLFEAVVKSPFTPSGNVGVRAAVGGGFELGASAQLPLYVSDKQAKIKQRLPSHPLFDEAKVEGDTVSASFTLPWVFRGAAKYDGGAWSAELDVYTELWSSFDAIRATPNEVTVTGVPGVGSVATGPLTIPRQYEDLIGVSLGGDYEALPDLLELRGGVSWEQSAIPTKTLSVLQVDADKLGLSLGASLEVGGGVAVDLSYTHLFYGQTTVTDSIVRQTNATDPENTTTVGNGRYTISAQAIGLGLRYDMQ